MKQSISASLQMQSNDLRSSDNGSRFFFSFFEKYFRVKKERPDQMYTLHYLLQN